MADIASRSCFAVASALCDIHHIARSVLHQIGEDHCIAGYAQKASTSHEPSIRPSMSSTPARMQLIRGRGRGRERGGVNRRGHARDGGSGHGPDSDSGLSTLEPTLPTSIPSYTYLSPKMFIPPDTCTSPSIPTHIDTSPSLPPHTYTSPSILPHTYTFVPYLVSTEPTSIAVDITLSSHPLPSHTLPPMDDTILDLLPEWGRLPARRPRTRRVHRLLHSLDASAPSAPSTPSAPSASSQTPQDPIGQQVVYSRRCPKKNIKASSCGTH